ncbi:MAG TPA: M48 family metalloprotease [Terriglobales bacterium]|nr:M48 family metalloprotease [Terriglobales bacterium]
MTRRLNRAFCVLLLLNACLPALAQFPRIPSGVTKATERARKAQDINQPWTMEQEIAFGEATAAKVINVFGLYENEEMVKYVNLVGNTVARNAPRRMTYHFAVLDRDILSAFALPGGFVFITRGALANMKSEAELAGVLAHEVAHVDGRHLEKQIRAKKTTQWLTQEGTAFIPGPSELRQLAQEMFTEVVTTRYSQDKEDEADRKGTQLAALAGYRPSGLRDFLVVLAAAQQNPANQQRLGLWGGSTHPPFAERIARLERILPEFGDTGQTLEERFTANVNFGGTTPPGGN